MTRNWHGCVYRGLGGSRCVFHCKVTRRHNRDSPCTVQTHRRHSGHLTNTTDLEVLQGRDRDVCHLATNDRLTDRHFDRFEVRIRQHLHVVNDGTDGIERIQRGCWCVDVPRVHVRRNRRCETLFLGIRWWTFAIGCGFCPCLAAFVAGWHEG